MEEQPPTRASPASPLPGTPSPGSFAAWGSGPCCTGLRSLRPALPTLPLEVGELPPVPVWQLSSWVPASSFFWAEVQVSQLERDGTGWGRGCMRGAWMPRAAHPHRVLPGGAWIPALVQQQKPRFKALSPGLPERDGMGGPSPWPPHTLASKPSGGRVVYSEMWPALEPLIVPLLPRGRACFPPGGAGKMLTGKGRGGGRKDTAAVVRGLEAELQAL